MRTFNCYSDAVAIVYKTVFISYIQSCISLTENYFLLKNSHSLIYHVYHVFVYVCVHPHASICVLCMCIFICVYRCMSVLCVCVRVRVL